MPPTATFELQTVAIGDLSIKISKVRGITVIATLAGISFLNTMSSGILASAIPQIARDVNLQRGLELWPAAVYAPPAGCLLLLVGALADSVVGAKPDWVVGSYLFCAVTVASSNCEPFTWRMDKEREHSIVSSQRGAALQGRYRVTLTG
ncbi:Drug resistance protein [Apiospora saccharicola]|uniref:Drug resistance protein n=1 Tax=Apiospora saccharicola TaxID=335842 RepID=A0ABR1UN36_9PEZI